MSNFPESEGGGVSHDTFPGVANRARLLWTSVLAAFSGSGFGGGDRRTTDTFKS